MCSQYFMRCFHWDFEWNLMRFNGLYPLVMTNMAEPRGLGLADAATNGLPAGKRYIFLEDLPVRVYDPRENIETS